MPIEVSCGDCGKTIRVPDKYAGKKVKCPKCRAPMDVPAGGGAKRGGAGGTKPRRASANPRTVSRQTPGPPRSSTPPPPGASTEVAEWHMQTEDGQEYGPITRSELDRWFGDGRIDVNCQILCTGWDQWKWAEEVFPELAEGQGQAAGGAPVADDNPFAGIGEAAAPAAQDPENPFDFSGGGAGAEENPYASPAVSGGAPPVQAQQPASGGGGEVSDNVILSLKGTKPWVLMLAILGFCGAAFMALIGLIVIVAATQVGIVGVLAACPYLIGAGVNGTSSFFLLQYSQRIQVLIRRGDTYSLEQAIDAQRTFWKFTGILVLVGIGLSILMMVLAMVMVGAVAAGAAGGMGGPPQPPANWP